MITISLDEKGHFEELARGKKTKGEENTMSFIAGITFDDKGIEGELSAEKIRIEKYLEGICKDKRAVYPKSLHSGGYDNRVSDIKEAIGETISSFLTDGAVSEKYPNAHSGIEEMPDRQGEYRIYALVGLDPESVKAREISGLLTEQGVASNLYVHMAETVVERLVFHNPIDKIRDVRLDLATRKSVVSDKEDDSAKVKKEYMDLGYKEDLTHKVENKEGKKHDYQVSNSYIYRTALEREIMKSERTDVNIVDFGVKSIYYNNKSKNGRMSFLFLADIVCSVLGYNLPKSKNGIIDSLKNRIEGLVKGRDNYLFFYDSVDLSFSRAWTAYEDGDYYKALYHLYEGKTNNKGAVRGFYEKYWYPKLIDRIIADNNPSCLERTIKRISDSTRENNLNQDRLKYIYASVQSIIEKLDSSYRTTNELSYDFYDAGLSIYNHLCDYRHANECFEKCEELASYVNVEKYLRTLNKQIVMLCDKGSVNSFEKAISLGKRNLRIHKSLSFLKRNFIVKEEKEDLDLAIAKSQLAQAYAFRRKPEAEKLFKEALDLYESKTSPDYLITCSYLLHYYIEVDNEKEYLKLSKEYFGGHRNLEKQFRYLVEEGSKEHSPIFSMKFAMYVFIKGTYKFRMDGITDKFAEMLADIDGTVESISASATKQLNGHPWEIIYKYLAFIMIEKGNAEMAKEYRKRVRKVVSESSGILDKIISKSIEEIDALNNGTEPKSKRLTYMYD